MNDFRRANRRLKIGLRAFERQSVGDCAVIQPRRRGRHDRDFTAQAAQGPGHSQDAGNHSAVAHRVQSVAEMHPAACASLADESCRLEQCGAEERRVDSTLVLLSWFHLAFTAGEPERPRWRFGAWARSRASRAP